MILLLDQGNHRLKWRRAGNDQDAVRPTAAAAWDEDWRSALGRDLDTPPLPSQAFVASVAGAERGAELRRFLEEKGVARVIFVASGAELGGVRNGYRDPVRLGIDRWCAAVAAWRRVRDAVLVADVGTAWTYDLVDASGRHLGGWIVPGPATQREALHAATAALPRLADAELVGTPEDLPVWGRDTEEAIRGGVRATAQGLVAVAEEAARERVGPHFARVATGGDREALALLRRRGYNLVDDLVLEGLALYACGDPAP